MMKFAQQALLSSTSTEESPLSSCGRVKIADSDPYFDLYQTIHSLVKESDTEDGLKRMQLPLKGEAIAGHCSDSSYFAAAVLLRVYNLKASQIFIHQLNQLLPKYGFHENYGHVILYVKNGGDLLDIKNHDVFFDATSSQFNGRLLTSPGDYERTNVYRNLCEFGEEGRKIARELICRGYVLIPNRENSSEKLTVLLTAYQDHGIASITPPALPLDICTMYSSSLDVSEPPFPENLSQWLRWKLIGDWRTKFEQVTSPTDAMSLPQFLVNHSGSRDHNGNRQFK